MIKFSIICPTLNEERYIGDILEAFVTYCPKPSELFVADGGSTDNTRAIVSEWAKKHDGIFLIDNEKRFVSYAFNTCYPLTKGKYVALLGAHTKYPPDFFEIAYRELESGEADVVGGPLRQMGEGSWGAAIAHCMSTRFGVGGTEFRVSKQRAYVDSVAFAFYKREIFEKIGLFDTSLKRNQDDEMHYRMNAAGFRILMVPEMQCDYYVRSSLNALRVQYFEYGFYKPLVLRKVTKGIRLRHLIPALFCLYVLLIPIALWFGIYAFVFPLVVYLGIDFIFSCINDLPVSDRLKALVVYPVLHVSYGLGFLFGIGRLIKHDG